jgi:uncharacterized protein (TIGR02058 family)
VQRCKRYSAGTPAGWRKRQQSAMGLRQAQASSYTITSEHSTVRSNNHRTTAMTKKRMVLEIGMGTDIRGADPTKAACRALRDALWHNSLSIAPALGQTVNDMIVDIHIGVPRPELVDKAEVMAVLPYGKGSVTVVEGGLEIKNDAGTNSTLIANACVVVSLDIA